MKITERFKKLWRRGRLKKAVVVNFRWALRRVRRFFQRDQFKRGIKGAYAIRLYTMAGILLGVAAVTVVSALLSDSWLTDEAVLVRRLSDPNYNQENPILCALDQFGSSNRIQVTVRTEKKDNLHPQKVDLDKGSLNLVMTLKNGSMMEYTLQNRNIDNFESGNTDQFTLILPDSISIFDITSYELVLLPDAKGEYGSWHCRWAQISCLLGGERTLLAEDRWNETFAFSGNQLSSVLEVVADENSYFAQVRELFPYVLEVCKSGQKTVHTKEIKREALESLGLSNGDVLYLDVETVGLENQHSMLDQLGGMEFSEYDQMDYDGTMTLRVRFYSDAGGAYYKNYNLDTPGKDDFELGNTSTFALNMPEGMSAFDILSMELLVHDAADLWAPRMIRVYLRTDFGTALELARITDTTLSAERRTAVFYKGLIDTSISPLRLELTDTYQLPLALREQVQEKFHTEIKGVTYSMYFNEFNFYERQKLFYSQIMAQSQKSGGKNENA